MLGVVFLFRQFLLIEIIVFAKKILYPIEDIEFLSSNVKRYFTWRLFFVKFWGFENCQIGPSSGPNYASFEEFFHIAESVTRSIYAWRIIQLSKVVPT